MKYRNIRNNKYNSFSRQISYNSYARTKVSDKNNNNNSNKRNK